MPKTIEIPSPPQVRIATVSTVEAAANAIRDLILDGEPAQIVVRGDLLPLLSPSEITFWLTTLLVVALIVSSLRIGAWYLLKYDAGNRD